jgi:hypothetical protein
MLKIVQPDLNSRNIKRYIHSAGFDAFNSNYLDYWLHPKSPYHAYGKSQILLAENDSDLLGGIVLTMNPRICSGNLISNFHSLWVRNSLNSDEKVNISKQLLMYSERIARKWGAERMIGPLSCNTWHNRYRVLFDTKRLSDSIPLFPGEVVEEITNKYYYESSGYDVNQLYISAAIAPHLLDAVNDLERNEEFTVKSLNRDEIHTVSYGLFPTLRQTFRNNYLFSDIDAEEFMALQNFHCGMRNSTKLYLAISNKTNAIASFLLKVSYVANGKVFHVIKTLGTSPAFKGQRLGEKLLRYSCRDIHDTARNRIIYALMMHGGTSAKISEDHKGEIFRIYALYGKSLL